MGEGTWRRRDRHQPGSRGSHAASRDLADGGDTGDEVRGVGVKLAPQRRVEGVVFAKLRLAPGAPGHMLINRARFVGWEFARLQQRQERRVGCAYGAWLRRREKGGALVHFRMIL